RSAPPPGQQRYTGSTPRPARQLAGAPPRLRRTGPGGGRVPPSERAHRSDDGRPIRTARLPGEFRAAMAPSVLEVDEQPPEVLPVLFHPVVFGPDLLLVEEPQDALLQLARSLARDDLHRLGLLPRSEE